MLLPSHSPSYSKSHGGQVKSQVTERKEMLLLFLKRGEWKMRGTMGQ